MLEECLEMFEFFQEQKVYWPLSGVYPFIHHWLLSARIKQISGLAGQAEMLYKVTEMNYSAI